MFTYGVEGRFMTTVGNNESMISYLITDQLGSMRVAMAGDPDDSTTEVRQYINNHPFGILAQSGGNYQADFRYTGHEYDAHGTFKFHYMGARYYDDRTGQFTGIDKAGEFASGYNYVGNDPIMRWDPDGNDGELTYWGNFGTPYVPYGPEPQDQPDFGNPWDYDWWSELSDAEIDRAIDQLNNSGNSEYINRGNGGGPMNMEPITDDAQAWADWYYNWQHSYDNPFSDEAYQAFYDLMHSVHVSQGLNRPSGNVSVRRKENHNRLCDKERQMALSLLNDVKFARQKIATAEKERLALVVSQQVATSIGMMGAWDLNGNGALDLAEANYNRGIGGGDIRVPASSLNLSRVTTSDFPDGVGSTVKIDLLFDKLNILSDGMVYGKLNFTLVSETEVSVQANRYDFNMEPWTMSSAHRNIGTMIGEAFGDLVFGTGPGFNITFTGTAAIQRGAF